MAYCLPSLTSVSMEYQSPSSCRCCRPCDRQYRRYRSCPCCASLWEHSPWRGRVRRMSSDSATEELLLLSSAAAALRLIGGAGGWLRLTSLRLCVVLCQRREQGRQPAAPQSQLREHVTSWGNSSAETLTTPCQGASCAHYMLGIAMWRIGFPQLRLDTNDFRSTCGDCAVAFAARNCGNWV